MWSRTYVKTYQNISKDVIWKLWADVNNYTNWHDDLDYCKLVGDFAVGNHFMLKPKGAPPVKVKIIELIESEDKSYKRFTDCSCFFGAKMYDIHELKETAEGLCITSTIKVTGFLGILWVNLVAKNVATAVPREIAALVKLAREQHG